MEKTLSDSATDIQVGSELTSLMSSDDWLKHLENLDKTDEIPDGVFECACKMDKPLLRTRFLMACKNALKGSRKREFDTLFKMFWTQWDQDRRQGEDAHFVTFTGTETRICTGEWEADDHGIYKRIQTATSEMVLEACKHPIYPSGILKNIDTGLERITLSYQKNGQWYHHTVNRSAVANAGKIVDALADTGIEVTSENSKNMVKYISDCVSLNQNMLMPKNSIGRLGWVGNEFSPYTENIEYEGDPAYETVFKSVKEYGDFESWKQTALECRKNLAIRLMMDTAIASPLLEKLGCLPFVTHLWGKTGGGKTVALKLCMSIWGDPALGGLVKTLNMTKNAMMRHAAFLHSIPFAGDELQTIKDRWGGNLDQMIMQICEGVDRGRALAGGGVEETRTWKNTFIFTGEEPITKSNSGGGVKNRSIEIEIDDYVIPRGKGHDICEIIDNNYGHAGRMLIEWLQDRDLGQWKAYRKTVESDMLENNDTEEKQAMAMSCILVADAIAGRCIFPGDEMPLQVSDVKHLLKSKSEVNAADRAYEEVISLISRNPSRFANPDDMAKDRVVGESWGKIDFDNNVCYINKSVLVEQMAKLNFDFSAVIKTWVKNKWIIKGKDGKNTVNTKVWNIQARYVKLKIDTSEDGITTDAEGFIQADGEIPFA